MDQNKVSSLAGKIKIFAISFIGIGILSQGTLYFKPQAVYNVPRILMPVLDAFGNIGLAIGMIVLGLGLLLLGFSQWRKVNGSVFKFLTFGVIATVVFYGLFFLTDYTKKNNSITYEEERENAIAQMKELEKPSLNNQAIENHFAEFDSLYKKLEESINANNKEAISKCEEGYVAWTTKISELYTGLSPEDMQKFALYCGKLSMKWQELSNKVQG